MGESAGRVFIHAFAEAPPSVRGLTDDYWLRVFNVGLGEGFRVWVLFQALGDSAITYNACSKGATAVSQGFGGCWLWRV